MLHYSCSTVGLWDRLLSGAAERKTLGDRCKDLLNCLFKTFLVCRGRECPQCPWPMQSMPEGQMAALHRPVHLGLSSGKILCTWAGGCRGLQGALRRGEVCRVHFGVLVPHSEHSAWVCPFYTADVCLYFLGKRHLLIQSVPSRRLKLLSPSFITFAAWCL